MFGLILCCQVGGEYFVGFVLCLLLGWIIVMNNKFIYMIKCIWFDENYNFVENMCIIINFVNLVRGVNCEENLCNMLIMMNNCFNSLVYWDNFYNDCYVVELDIIFVEMNIV